jgi:GNAT superfamily N-acetyltransferase
MFKTITAHDSHFEEVCAWLEREHEEDLSGFYFKKQELAESLAAREMFCGISDGSAIAFATFSIKSSGYVDIMEVHPKHRRCGFGRKLACFTIGHLFKSGVSSIYVTCAPRSSEPFWRSIGFSHQEKYRIFGHEHPRLVLHRAP